MRWAHSSIRHEPVKLLNGRKLSQSEILADGESNR